MANSMNERRVISVIVLNESSVLARVTSLFAARGYNIASLTVAPIPDSEMSHITIETNGSPKVMEQITKQLHKLIPVYKVIEHEEMVEKGITATRQLAKRQMTWLRKEPDAVWLKTKDELWEHLGAFGVN